MLPKKRKSHCNSCQRETHHDELCVENQSWENERMSAGASHYFLKCCGCDHVSYRIESWNSEDVGRDYGPNIDVAIYPWTSSTRSPPSWFAGMFLDASYPPYLEGMLKEVYDANDRGHYWLAIMGVRAVIETVMLSNIPDQGSFVANLSEFTKQGFITDSTRLALSAAIDKGSAAIHKGHMPESGVALAALQIAENLVEIIFVNPSREQRLRK